MEFDLGLPFHHHGPHFQDSVLQGIHLSRFPSGLRKSGVRQRVEEDLGRRVEEESELVGFKGVTGRSVGV